MDTEAKIALTVGTIFIMVFLAGFLLAIGQDARTQAEREEKLDSCILSEKVRMPSAPKRSQADENDAVENCIKRYKE